MFWDSLKKDMEDPAEVIKYMEENAITTTHKYCKWLEECEGDVLIRTFAFKEDKRKGLEWTEVERAIPGKEYSLQKNIYLTAMSGYRCVFKPCNKTSSSWYGYNYYYFEASDFDKWFTNKALPGWMGQILNLDKLFTIEKYKYCGYSCKQGLKEYLEFYNEDHDVEFFGKLGLVYQKSLARDAKKDKQFKRFLFENAEDVNRCKYVITRLAYKNHISFKEAEKIHRDRVDADRMFRELPKVPYKVDKVKIFKYVRNLMGYYYGSYRDYWTACVELGLDMRLSKNSMPNNFTTMHDIRIDEYASLKAKREANERRALNRKLKQIAEAWTIEVPSKKYEVILPRSKKDFEREGNALGHCVGRMGYDTRVKAGKILIGFIRLKEEPTKPYVTAEYDLKTNRIVQMHGYNNKTPNKETAKFIEEWAKALKKRKVTA